MRIEPGVVLSRYQAYKSAGTASPVKQETSASLATEAARGNTDVVSISGAAARDSGIGRLTQSIAAELETAVPAQRLQALQEKVQSGEYFVSSQELARAMLGLRG